jgi:hypothetical protein
MKSFEAENLNKVYIYSPPFPNVVVYVGCNIKCQLSSLFVMKERSSALSGMF